MTEHKLWYKSWPKGVRKELDYPLVSVHDHFEKLVTKNAERTYLSILGLDYSYAEVNDQANKFASALVSLGVNKGDRIGIFMPNIPQFVISFFGILKAGAIAVPISPLYGSRDMRFVLKDASIKLIVALDLLFPTLQEVCPECVEFSNIVITSLGDLLSPVKRFLAKALRKLPKSPAVAVETRNLFELINTHEPLDNSIKRDPGDTAVICYTGGTTGTPKGAMLTHENLICNIHQAREWAIEFQPEGVSKSFVGAVPFFHIIGLTTTMLTAAQYDSTIYLVPDPRRFESILQLISKNKINYLQGVPTMFRALLNHPNFIKHDLSSLDIVLSGAAPLPDDLARKFESAAGCMMVEAFGMTETSPIVTANPFEQDNRKTGSIGIPFPDTDIKIVDMDTGKELPPGKVGEIAVSGPQVMKGYFNKPDETENALKEINGSTYMHTGDIGYMDEEGFIFIVNRKKDMINVSGYKVFPSELEELILEIIPAIDEVAVIGIKDEYSGEAVKVVATLKDGQSLEEEKLIESLKGKVARYKLPKTIEFRSELPKTGIGKIDRLALSKEESEGNE